jgi:hypothetical protein
MNMDEQGGGTNKDGSRSTVYCSNCYQKGVFTDNFTTAKEMVTHLKEELRKQGFGPIKRFWYTSHISQLARWKQKDIR